MYCDNIYFATFVVLNTSLLLSVYIFIFRFPPKLLLISLVPTATINVFKTIRVFIKKISVILTTLI